MYILLDIAAVIMLVVCAAMYAHKGFLSGLVVLVGTLLAVVAASLLANTVSPAVFESVFRQSLEQRTVEAIGQQSVDNLGEVLHNVLAFLPGETVDAIVDNIGAGVDFTAADIAHQVVEEIIAPLIIPIISIIVFFVVFAILKVLVRLLSSALTGMNRMPVLGTVNRALGAAMGIFLGAIYVYLVLCVIWAVDAAYGGTLANDLFNGSIVYALLENMNIFA